ncbi:filamentous hemagglutinin N-terminal domain-containing protein [Scytonema sp. PCC 10023]|uniref:two-partner secretion domain-containing protein n=1 Tax=Scytonema sp. PCC 10023 TaxID=1680591 RepID=UPI0039C756C7
MQLGGTMSGLGRIRCGWFLGIAIGSVSVCSANCAIAQITPDATLPNNSSVTRESNIFNITGGTQAGSNLFHSFEQFSVPTGSTAYFNNAVDIHNIISRVTGKSISNIDGLIQANGRANLFLMNPNGIIFRPNASLNIGGSFLATTASSFKFADGSFFSAVPSSQNQPLLTITAPVGLGMGSNPGTIQVQGSGHDIDYQDLTKPGPRGRIDTSFTGLRVEPGKTLALVGGNVSLEGGVLTSKAGRVEIGSVASNQVVNLVPLQEGWKLGYEGTPSFRDIQFSDKAFVNTTGDGSGSIAVAGRNINFIEQSILLADTLGDKNGGEISIVGNSIVFNQSNISSNTFSSGNAGQIKLDANNIKFENRSSASIQTGNSGDAGNINIRTNSLAIEGSALASITQADSTGKAGDINIIVKGPLMIVGAGIVTDTFGTGNAGKISINANSLRIEDSFVSSGVVKAAGQAGEINLNVAGSVAIKGTDITTGTSGTGDAGKISINANSFQFEDGGVQSNTEENSTGKAGEININVALSLELPNKAGIRTNSLSQGDAGKIDIRANSFLLENSGVGSNTVGSSTGKAGEMNITVADQFTIKRGGAQTNTLNDVTAGDLKVRAKTLVLDNGGGLEVRSTGSGDAGNLTIVADTIKLEHDSAIRATTTSGNGGNLQLNVAKLLLLRDGSSISATAGTENAGGNGGNITIDVPKGFIVTVRGENSDITANAFNGKGGNVIINATGIFGIAPLSRQDLEKLNPDIEPRQISTNDITAISQTSPTLNGQVTINTPNVDLNRGLVQLPTNLVDASQQIDTSCNPNSRQRASSFVMTGRGGLPPNPINELLESDAVLVDWISLKPSTEKRSTASVTTKASTPIPEPIVEATGWVINKNGEVVLTANPPTTTPHSPWLTPASCRA